MPQHKAAAFFMRALVKQHLFYKSKIVFFEIFPKCFTRRILSTVLIRSKTIQPFLPSNSTLILVGYACDFKQEYHLKRHLYFCAFCKMPLPN